MKALRVIFSILGIAAFGVVASHYIIFLVNHGFKYVIDDGVYSIIYFSLFGLSLLSLFHISFSNLVGKRGNVGFFIAALTVIGRTVLRVIERGGPFALDIVLGSCALLAIVAHIIRGATGIKFVAFIAAVLLGFPLFYLKGFAIPLSKVVEILSMVLIVVSLLSYSFAAMNMEGLNIRKAKEKAPETKQVKEDKPAKKEEPKAESAPAPHVPHVHAGKKIKQWTDEYGFTYTNLP